jgi:chloramphenicol 3-O phosphotransferase
MAAGTIIYLNGTSSSGKTSITRALHEQLDQPYLHCPIDLFELMIPGRQIERGIFPDLNKIESGFTACIAALASTGNNIIVDDVMCEPFGQPEGQTPMTTRKLLRQRVSALHTFNILYVKVHCPLPMVQQREQARGNRTIGLASFQYQRMHHDSLYDVEVDTSLQTPDACAAQILTTLSQMQAPRAFQTMAKLFNV